jgi:hypothetical protein
MFPQINLKEFVRESLRLKESPVREAHFATYFAKTLRYVQPYDPALSAIRFRFELIDNLEFSPLWNDFSESARQSFQHSEPVTFPRSLLTRIKEPRDERPHNISNKTAKCLTM